MNHCVYMTKGISRTLYGEEPAYNQILLKFAGHGDQQLLAEALLGEELIVFVSLVEELQDALNDIYNMDVAMYVYRENLFLTIFGILLGLVLGTWLHQYLITMLEVDLIMFGRQINPVSYLYSTLFTIAFTVFVNIGMFYKLKQIDMIESLKSVE